MSMLGTAETHGGSFDEPMRTPRQTRRRSTQTCRNLEGHVWRFAPIPPSQSTSAGNAPAIASAAGAAARQVTEKERPLRDVSAASPCR